MSYEFYKLIHFIGIILLFSGLTGLLTVKMSNGHLVGQTKKLIFISHGIGLLFILVSGFGLLAKLSLTSSMPNWVYGKLTIWLMLGGAISYLKRKGQLGWPLFITLIGFFSVAAYFAVFKPF